MDLTDLERFVMVIKNGASPKGEQKMDTTTETTVVDTTTTTEAKLTAAGLAARFGVDVGVARGFANFLTLTGRARAEKLENNGRKGPRTTVYVIPETLLANFNPRTNA